MKKFWVLAVLSIITMLVITSCDEETPDPDPFTNGLMVTFGDIGYNTDGSWRGLLSATYEGLTARKDVNCTVTTSPLGKKADFKATTADGKEWNIVFFYDPAAKLDTIWISDNISNKIRLTSAETAWNYYIDSSINDEFKKKTYIIVSKLIPDTILEARFGGYFFAQGTTTKPDSLFEGYIHINEEREWVVK